MWQVIYETENVFLLFVFDQLTDTKLIQVKRNFSDIRWIFVNLFFFLRKYWQVTPPYSRHGEHDQSSHNRDISLLFHFTSLSHCCYNHHST